MKLTEAKKESIQKLKKAGFVHAEREIDLVCQHLLDIPSINQLTTDRSLSAKQVDTLKRAVTQRLKGEPLSYILGTQAFRNLTLQVDRRALIPRSETEQLVELAINNRPEKVETILELGTGSGAIAISLKKEFPKSKVIATDISQEAISLARENATLHKTSIDFLVSDLFDRVPNNKYDLIVANLPYVPKERLSFVSDEILDWEPMIAVTGGGDGLETLRRFIAKLPDYTHSKTVVALEMWHTHGQTISALLEELLPGKRSEIHQDLASFDRFVLCR